MLPECEQSTSSCEIKLRELEIDSYSKILSVFRARGNLTNDRRKLLKQIGSFLNISQERHRAEVRRVTNDDLLSTIASRLTGQDWTVDWNEEGKRLVPTPTPFSHFTVNTPLADYIASVASLGKKYVDLYNKRICDPVPNEKKVSEPLASNCEKSPEKWLSEINQVYASSQKEKLKDVSIQTIKKKVIPKKCTYCERRKELRKKKLELKESKKSTDKNNLEENTETEKCILLPSGKQILVENAFDDQIGDLSVSVIAQEIVVETEPTAGPSHFQDLDDSSIEVPTAANSPLFNLTTPDFTGLNIDSSKVPSKDYNDPSSLQLFTNIWEDCDKPPPPRIPRILNSGPRKRVRKQNLHSPVKCSFTGDRIIRKKSVETFKDSYFKESSSGVLGSPQVQVRYPVPAQIQPPCGRQGLPKQQPCSALKQGDGITRQHEGLTKLPSSRNTENTSKHHIGVLRYHDVFSKHHENTTKHRDLIPKNREIISKQHEVLLKHHEGLNKYPEVVPKRIDSSSKPSGGIYKHYVRVRHTPKASRPFPDASKHHTEVQSSKQTYGEAVEIPIEYLHSEQRSSETCETQMEVVDLNDYRMTTAGLPYSFNSSQKESESVSMEPLDDVLNETLSSQPVASINFFSPDSADNLVEEILIPSTQISPPVSNSEGRNVVQREENSPRTVIKIYNGENKVHGPIHFCADQLKDILHKFPSTQISQVEVNNGRQPEENTALLQSQSIWDGANMPDSEFIMEDVSIVDESSYPLVNGHEEIILEEEVLTGR